MTNMTMGEKFAFSNIINNLAEKFCGEQDNSFISPQKFIIYQH